jgi:hypothetical protein
MPMPDPPSPKTFHETPRLDGTLLDHRAGQQGDPSLTGDHSNCLESLARRIDTINSGNGSRSQQTVFNLRNARKMEGIRMYASSTTAADTTLRRKESDLRHRLLKEADTIIDQMDMAIGLPDPAAILQLHEISILWLLIPMVETPISHEAHITLATYAKKQMAAVGTQTCNPSRIETLIRDCPTTWHSGYKRWRLRCTTDQPHRKPTTTPDDRRKMTTQEYVDYHQQQHRRKTWGEKGIHTAANERLHERGTMGSQEYVDAHTRRHQDSIKMKLKSNPTPKPVTTPTRPAVDHTTPDTKARRSEPDHVAEHKVADEERDETIQRLHENLIHIKQSRDQHMTRTMASWQKYNDTVRGAMKEVGMAEYEWRSGTPRRADALKRRYRRELRSDHGRMDPTASISIQVTFRHTCKHGVRHVYTITDNHA